MPHLLTLPLEIKNSIYFLLLLPPQAPDPYSFITRPMINSSIQFQGKTGDIHLRAQMNNAVVQFTLSPQIMTVCRQLRDETAPIFYGMNIFMHRKPKEERGNLCKKHDEMVRIIGTPSRMLKVKEITKYQSLEKVMVYCNTGTLGLRQMDIPDLKLKDLTEEFLAAKAKAHIQRAGTREWFAKLSNQLQLTRGKKTNIYMVVAVKGFHDGIKKEKTLEILFKPEWLNRQG